MKNKIVVLENIKESVYRFTIVKNNGDAFVMNSSPFSYPKGHFGYFGNVLKGLNMDEFLFKTKKHELYGKLVDNHDVLPVEIKRYISELA